MRRPGRSVAICIAMIVVGSLSILWGWNKMNVLGAETQATAAAISLGLLGVLLGFPFLFNFLWAARLVNALRRGEGVIGRWTVAPATFEMFREREKQLRAAGDDNDYRVPTKTPPAGLEVIFSEDSVLIGDTFFGLSTSGMARFRGIRMVAGNPSCLAFETALTMVSKVSYVRVHNIRGVLRVPVGHDAHVAAARVAGHFQDVIARKVIVKPEFWRRRVRWGLIAAVISGTICAAGFALEAGDAELGIVPLVMAVAGAVTGVGGLILAILAALVGRFQRTG